MASSGVPGTSWPEIPAHSGQAASPGRAPFASNRVNTRFVGLAGLVAAVFMARLMTTFLYRVEPFDLATFGGAVVVLLITAALATAIPALRATRVDPVTAFKEE